MATATLTDMSILATDVTFQNRVAEALFVYCWSVVPAESVSATNMAQHTARKALAASILNNPSNYKPLFVNVVAANQTCANEATVSGALTAANVAANAALVTDTDISNAVAAAFNAFIAGI